MSRRVTFSLDPDVAEDLEALANLVGIRQYKGRLVNLLLQRSLGPYQPAIARARNGHYASVGSTPIIRQALVEEVDAAVE